MDLNELIVFGAKHLKNAVAEEVYVRSGFDFTKPINFFGLVNQRCNVKCRYCALTSGQKVYLPQACVRHHVGELDNR